MTTPISAHICVWLKPMRNAMVELFFVWIYLVTSPRNALCDNVRVTLFVTGVLAVHTLVSTSVFEEITTVCTFHDIVKLMLDKLVAVHFMNLLLLLSNGTLSSETTNSIVGSLSASTSLFKSES